MKSIFLFLHFPCHETRILAYKKGVVLYFVMRYSGHYFTVVLIFKHVSIRRRHVFYIEMSRLPFLGFIIVVCPIIF